MNLKKLFFMRRNNFQILHTRNVDTVLISFSAAAVLG